MKKNSSSRLDLREVNWIMLFRSFVFCTIGASIMAFNLNSFVNTGDLFPGGFAGVALLIIRILKRFFGIAVSYSAIYIPINLIPVYIGIKFLGKRFTFFTLYVIVLSSILTDVFPKMPVTYDVFLIALFGGLINGLAISICLFVGASSGGTDFITMYFSEEKGIDAWNYVLLANAGVLVTAGILFGMDKPLYSIVYQFCTTQVIHTLFKRYNRHTLIIITEKTDQVYDGIRNLTNHDATLFKGVGMFERKERKMIYSVVSSDEVNRVVNRIEEIDPSAFINILRSEDVRGNFYQNRNYK